MDQFEKRDVSDDEGPAMIFNCKNCGSDFKRPPSRPSDICRDCYGPNHYNRTHGQSESPEYNSWRHMKQRCTNPKRIDYAWYGARGIKVCERWQGFDNFLADMGLKPSPDHTLDRLDFNGNYEPSNCRWSTKDIQGQNRRGVYTAEEDQKIREGVALGLNFPKLALYVGKSEKSVTARTYRIGLKSGTPLCQKVTDRNVA